MSQVQNPLKSKNRKLNVHTRGLSQPTIGLEEVWRVAEFLFMIQADQVGESFIDGCFYLTLWHLHFRAQVQDIRQRFWGTSTPPLKNEPGKLFWPFSGSLGPAVYRAPNWSDADYSLFSQFVAAIQAEYALPPYVEETVLYGVPAPFSYVRIAEEYELISEEREIKMWIFGSRITGQQLAKIYKAHLDSEKHSYPLQQAHRKTEAVLDWELEQNQLLGLPCIRLNIKTPFPPPAGLARYYNQNVRISKKAMGQLYCGDISTNIRRGRPSARQFYVSQIRACAIYTAVAKAGIPSVRAAMKEFNRRFPTFANQSFEDGPATQDAEMAFQREKKNLLIRMPWLKRP